MLMLLMLTRMQPPTTGTPSSKILFWFLAWHLAEFKEPFEFHTQKELAQASGVSEDALSRIIRDPPGWFGYDGRRAYIERSKLDNGQ